MSAASVGRWLHLLPRRSLIFLIELYRTWVSPLRLPTCRFEPTCSAYAVQALSRHGLVYGGGLTLVRLSKCGPWHKIGCDPVPDEKFWERADIRERFRLRVAGRRSLSRHRDVYTPVETAPLEVRGN